MAFYEELRGAAKAAVDAMRAELFNRAMRSGLSQDELVLRPLRPGDIGASSNTTWGTLSIGTANTFTDLVAAQTVASDRFVGIYGVSNNEALGELEQVRIRRKGSDTRFWHVAHLASGSNNVGFVDDPVILDENTQVTVSFSARTTSTVSEYAFIGDVVERKGLLINPSS